MSISPSFARSLATCSALAAIAACSHDQNAQTPAGYGGSGGYAPAGTYTAPAGTYPAPGGYTAPGSYPAPTYPQPTTPAYPTAPAPAATATGIIPCQSDATCGFHRCNPTSYTCAFPCGGPQDCAAGSSCSMGLCVPGTR